MHPAGASSPPGASHPVGPPSHGTAPMGVLTAGEAPSGAAKAAAALAAAATLATPHVGWSAVGHQPHAQAHNAQPQPCVVLPSPLPSEHPTSNSLRDGQATRMELTGAQETKAAEASGQVASGPMAGGSLPAEPVLVAIGMSTCTVAHPKEEVVGAAAPLPCTEHPELPGLEGQGLAAGRRKRVPGGHVLEVRRLPTLRQGRVPEQRLLLTSSPLPPGAQNPRFQEFLEALRSSSAAIGQAGGRVLRLKQYIGADARPQVIDAVLDALEHNNRVEALYIQNFEKVRRVESGIGGLLWHRIFWSAWRLMGGGGGADWLGVALAAGHV